jgi:DNA polymerase-1
MNSSTALRTKKLLLIDGNAIVHRAYHALPPLSAPDGTVVNALYGFLSMFFTVITDLKPEYIIVSFDISKPTHRQALYAGYQQGRPTLTDDLIAQFAMIHEALEKMNISIFEVEGYEADDVIGTIANQMSSLVTGQSRLNRDQSSEIIETIILTGDRDLLQLVNKTTKVLMPIVGVKETKLYDEAAVEEKFGVTPAQFIDYKALVGDASDGYPGVTGIGPKTASSLLQKYNTFEYMYEHLGELPQKIAEKLATDAEQAALAKKLAAIVTDVPVTCKIEKCRWRDFDTNGAMKVFQIYGFDSLIRRFAPLFKDVNENKNGEQLGLL